MPELGPEGLSDGDLPADLIGTQPKMPVTTPSIRQICVNSCCRKRLRPSNGTMGVRLDLIDMSSKEGGAFPIQNRM